MSSINPIFIDTVVGANGTTVKPLSGQNTSFKDLLYQALNNVNSLIQDSSAAGQALATGDIQDIHSAMIAAEKADIALQFTIQIRNKIIDAYNEIMHMQV